MTDNHEYETPAAGSLDWDKPLNRNFERIDTDVEIRDTDANRSNYTPKAGTKFLATDTGVVYVGDSSDWVPQFVLAAYDPSTDEAILAPRLATGELDIETLTGAITGGAALTDIAGDNLSISNGQLNASTGGGGGISSLTGGDGIDPSAIGDGDTLSVAWGDGTDFDADGSVNDWSGAADLDASGSVNDWSGAADLDSSGAVDTISGSVTGGTTLTDIAGDNLSISNGQLNASTGGGQSGSSVSSLLLDGYVVALGPNISEPQAVDPADTATPIQDALDIVDSAGGGDVRLPGGTIEETGPIRPYAETQIIGRGVDVTKVSITDQSADGIRFDRGTGTSRVLLDGFALNGPAGTQPTGVAIHHVDGDTQDLFVGRLLLWGWHNSVYRVDEGVGPFQCRHEQLTIYECDAGDQDGLFEFRSWYGPANWFGTIAAYPSANVSAKNTTVFFSRGGTQTVDYLTMGGSAGIAIDQTWDSLIEFGNVHWEPTSNPTDPPAIVRLRGHGTALIDTVKHVTGTADYVYELAYDSYNARGPARKVLGPYIELGAEADITTNVVNLSYPADAAAPSLYQGAPEDVSVTHSEGSTGGLRALGTAGTGF
jgi:hypothetical protein